MEVIKNVERFIYYAIVPTIVLVLLLMSKANSSENIQKEAYLFVQSSSRATVQEIKNQPGTYTVTLERVSPMVTYFSDRPNRDCGIIPMDQYLKLWHYKGARNFKDNPPNAVLNSIETGLLSSDKVLNFAIQVIEPVYDRKSETMTFTANPLVGNLNEIKPLMVLNHVSIFVDDACLSCMWE